MDIFFSTLLVILRLTVFSAASSTPFSPSSVPLAVRSPYLSAWLPYPGTATALNSVWPGFWNYDTLGWAGFVNVDGKSYNFMGTPDVANTVFNKTVQQSLVFTSTQSTFVMTAGPVDLTIQFLSPIEPSDLVNQSFPFSYMAMTAKPNDNGSHKVEVYTDISAEWVFGNDSMVVNWTTTTGNAIIHQTQLENQTLFLDVDDRIQQGSVYYSTLNTPGTTYQTGRDIDVRAQFINNSELLNTQDKTFREIGNNDWPVFAFAYDMGTISGQSDTFVVAIGHARDPVIEYVTANDVMQQRSSYFWTRYSTIEDAIITFLGDYSNAVVRANNFDSQVVTDSSVTTFPPNYGPLVELSMRQAFGAIEITVSKDSSGSYNTSDVTAFLKEISSSGAVSTADVIFPMWPVFLYTNPALGKAILLPLLEYQASGQYPNQWAMHDLGPSYPQAVGYPKGNDDRMPVEECGNMLIMTLSYAQKTGDKSLISSYYSLLGQWTEYLISNALEPAYQSSSDVFAGSLTNQTNLAIKGIIAIQAMAEMAQLVGDSATSSSHNSTAQEYITKWQQLATASDGLHLTLSYGNDSSWGLTYNMYADKLLGTNIIPSSVYEMQTTWYSNNLGNQYGIPLDTRHTYVLTGWELWTAAFVTDSTVRDALINDVVSYLSDGQNIAALGDWYDTVSGKAECPSGYCFRARPVVGAHLALMVLPSADFGSANSSTGGTGTGGSNGTGSGGGNSTAPKSKSSGAQLFSKWTMSLSLSLTVVSVLRAFFF